MSGRCSGWVIRSGPRPHDTWVSGERVGTPYGSGVARAMRAVLGVVADAANSDGQHAYPGVAAMVEGSLYSRSRVLEIIEMMVRERWLEVEEEGRGRGHATVYTVVMDRRRKVQSSDRLLDEKGPMEAKEESDLEAEKVQNGEPSPYVATGSTVDNGGGSSEPRRRACRIRGDFVLTPAMQSWAGEHAPDCRVARETARFVEYYTATGRTMKDWTAAWRNWMLKAQTDAEHRRSNGQGKMTRLAEA